MMSTSKATGSKANAVKRKSAVKPVAKSTAKPKAPAKPTEDEAPKTNEPKGDVIGSLKGGKEVHQKLKTVRVKAMR